MNTILRAIPNDEPDAERLTTLLSERRGLRARLAELEDAIDREILARASKSPEVERADEPLIVDRREAARRLGGISVKTVVRLEEAGELQRVSIGDRRFVTVESIERHAGRPYYGHTGR